MPHYAVRCTLYGNDVAVVDCNKLTPSEEEDALAAWCRRRLVHRRCVHTVARCLVGWWASGRAVGRKRCVPSSTTMAMAMRVQYSTGGQFLAQRGPHSDIISVCGRVDGWTGRIR